MKKLALILSLGAPLLACGQSSVNGGGSLTTSGPVTAGHCASFLSSTAIQDSGSACGGGGANPGWNTVTNGANANTLTETTNGSLIPSQTSPAVAFGQITSLADWIVPAVGAILPNAPALSASSTGGSLGNGTYLFKLTYAGLSVTVPSGEVRIVLDSTNCGTSTCQITVGMPATCQSGSIPAGATGCTVWDGTSSGAEKQQAASNACVNIATATCVVNVLAAGAALATPASTGITPPSLQSQAVPNNVIPSGFSIKGDGNSYPLYGMDMSALNIITNAFPGGQAPIFGNGVNGTFSWLDRIRITDATSNSASGALAASNSLVSITHQSGNATGTCASPCVGPNGIDDRSLIIVDFDSPAHPNYEQWLGQYIEHHFSQNAFDCLPGSFGTGENCVAGGRFTTDDDRVSPTHVIANAVGASGTLFITQPQSSGYGACNVCGGGLVGSVNVGAPANLNGAAFAGVTAGLSGFAGVTNGSGYLFYASPIVTRFPTKNVVFEIPSTVIGSATSADMGIENSSTLNNKFLGPLYLGGTNTVVADNGTFAVQGSQTVAGSLSTSQLGTAPSTGGFSHNGSAGSTTNTYIFCGIDALGGQLCSASANDTTANANLTSTNSTNVVFHPVNSFSTAPVPFASVKIYRTVSGSTCNGSACTNGVIGSYTTTDGLTAGISPSIMDQGQAGDGTSPSALNTTGTMQGVALRTPAVAFASLPACSSTLEGMMRAITDSTTATWGATISGSSTNHVLGYCDGTNWTVMAK